MRGRLPCYRNGDVSQLGLLYESEMPDFKTRAEVLVTQIQRHNLGRDQRFRLPVLRSIASDKVMVPLAVALVVLGWLSCVGFFGSHA